MFKMQFGFLKRFMNTVKALLIMNIWDKTGFWISKETIIRAVMWLVTHKGLYFFKFHVSFCEHADNNLKRCFKLFFIQNFIKLLKIYF